MILNWCKVCIQVLENNLEFCISVNGEHIKTEKHTSKESMEDSINDWIRFYFPYDFGEGTEFEILRYR